MDPSQSKTLISCSPELRSLVSLRCLTSIKFWGWLGPQRNRTFLWQVAHGRLMTNSERASRGISSTDVCPRCQDQTETIMHALRDCEVVKDFWNPLVSQEKWSSFFSMGLHAWLDLNLTSKEVSKNTCHWSTFYSGYS